MANKQSKPTVVNIFSYYTALELEKHNFDFQPFCQKHNVNKQDLFNQKKRLPLKVELDLLGIANDVFENKLWPLEHQKNISIGALRHIDWMVDTSLNFGQALEKITKYVGFINEALEINITYGAKEFSVTVAIRYPVSDSIMQCLYEDIFKGLVDTLNLHTEWECQPKAIYFKHSPHAPMSVYNTYFSCPLYFNASENKVVFDNETLNTPMQHSDPVLHKMIQLQLEKDMDVLKIPYEKNLIEYLKSYILTHLTEKAPKIHEAAKEVGMSTRSLQRALKTVDTSYVKLLDEVRHQLASKYLSANETPLADISFHLGFADQSSFNRVFKKWTGMSPLQYKYAHSENGLNQAIGS